MNDASLGAAREAEIEALVEHYKTHRSGIETLAKLLRGVIEDSRVAEFIHSLKWRVKDPEHLRDKLRRKYRDSIEAKSEFGLDVDNLFEKVTDLAGVRIIHLYTHQFPELNARLLDELDYHRYQLVEQPFARAWDDETREFYERCGIQTKKSHRFYTSVHYVVQPNVRRKATAELQVRTLAEEIWGEVDHLINYPHPSESFACREQIKVLARLTSSCGRLVDSIFATHRDHYEHSGANPPASISPAHAEMIGAPATRASLSREEEPTVAPITHASTAGE